MIINPSTELFFTANTKIVSGNSEKSNSLSFQDCMKGKVDDSKNTKEMDDTFKTSTEKSDYKRDSYKDSSSRVKKSESSENQDVKELSKDDLEKMSDEMKEKIMDELSMSEEELEEIMSALNLSWMDLLNPDKLQALVLACEGKGQVDLLTDENLNQCLQDILGDLKELLSDYGIDFEQLESSIQSLDAGNFEDVLSEAEDAAVGDAEIKTDIINDAVQNEKVQESQGDKKLNDTSSDEEKSFARGEKSEDSIKTENVGKAQQVTTTVVQQDFQQMVTTVHETDSQGVVSQVITQVKVMVSEDTNSLQMQLYPEHLGKLSIEISEKSGVMSAQLIVESEDAKQALVASMNELKDAFQEQNIKISEIEVSVAPKSFEQQEQSSKDHPTDSKKSSKSGLRNLRLDDLLDDEVEELMEEEKIAVEMMQLSGSSVDFSA
ncbi:MAG: flagellar hook-length control protein FliK [Lachnospiraceae bacterium]|nr:flagellar hook-length control protein FliK [Lachnospiraceae bacterium]